MACERVVRDDNIEMFKNNRVVIPNLIWEPSLGGRHE